MMPASFRVSATTAVGLPRRCAILAHHSCSALFLSVLHRRTVHAASSSALGRTLLTGCLAHYFAVSFIVGLAAVVGLTAYGLFRDRNLTRVLLALSLAFYLGLLGLFIWLEKRGRR